MQNAHSFLSQLPSLPPNPAGTAHGTLPWALDVALAVVWLILAAGTCTALSLVGGIITAATHWLVRVARRHLSEEAGGDE